MNGISTVILSACKEWVLFSRGVLGKRSFIFFENFVVYPFQDLFASYCCQFLLLKRADVFDVQKLNYFANKWFS